MVSRLISKRAAAFPCRSSPPAAVEMDRTCRASRFVPFGVQLQFTPFIQDRDVIRLQVNAEVSTRDESLGTTIGGAGNGTQVSGLNSRNFATTVKLRSGQSIASRRAVANQLWRKHGPCALLGRSTNHWGRRVASIEVAVVNRNWSFLSRRTWLHRRTRANLPAAVPVATFTNRRILSSSSQIDWKVVDRKTIEPPCERTTLDRSAPSTVAVIDS